MGLKAVFNPFGRVDLVQIIRDNDTNASKGYAFITFAEAQQAKQALDQLQGFDIAGRPIRLNTVSSSAEVSTSALGGPGFLDNDAIERNGIDLGTTGRLPVRPSTPSWSDRAWGWVCRAPSTFREPIPF